MSDLLLTLDVSGLKILGMSLAIMGVGEGWGFSISLVIGPVCQKCM